MAKRRVTALTKTEIFKAALQLIDAHGVEALTMRRLARELGVEAMSLYHHVPNKQALLNGVVELSLTAQALPQDAVGHSWREVVLAAVCGFRRALVAHPNVLPLMVAHPPTSPEAAAAYIHGPLSYLIELGFAGRDAAQLFEAVFALSLGHALLTSHYPALELDDVPPVEFTEGTFERSVRVLIDGYASQTGV